MSVIVLNIPHSSSFIPQKYRPLFIVNEKKINEELRCMTDWYVDELFRHFYQTETVKTDVSRLICDTERFADDSVEQMARKGMGVIYTHSHNGDVIKKVPDGHKDEILKKYYRYHHRKLTRSVASMLKTWNRALIIDCHSFSSVPFDCDRDQHPDRPDFCIGIDPFHTPYQLVDYAYSHFSANGKYSVDINTPFYGSIVPEKYYRKDSRVHSIMIEVNRSLYMDEQSLAKKPEFHDIHGLIEKFLDTICNLRGEDYALLDRRPDRTVVETVRESNNIITCFEQTRLVEKGIYNNLYRCDYRLDRTSVSTIYCTHIIGTDFIDHCGQKLKLSNRAARQMRDEWHRVSGIIGKTNTEGIIIHSTKDTDWRLLRLCSNCYSLVRNYKSGSTVNCSRILVDNENWHGLADCVMKTEDFPLSYMTAKKLQEIRPDLTEAAILNFNELEAELLINTTVLNDRLLSSGIMYIHEIETSNDMKVLAELDKAKKYFTRTNDVYDLSNMAIETVANITTGYTRRIEYLQLGIIIDDKHFKARWNYNDKLLFQSDYRSEEIKITEDLSNTLKRIDCIMQEKHMERFREYDFNVLVREVLK